MDCREELFQGDCTLDNNYGYREGKPCILIKLNRIYGWKPEPYNLRYGSGQNTPRGIRKTVERGGGGGMTSL
jgi:sodium/potassium-transporting ATPase subunit beta